MSEIEPTPDAPPPPATVAAPAAAPAPVPAPAIPEGWQPLPSAAATTAMFGGAAWALVLGGGACFFVGWPLLVARGVLDLAWWQGLALMFAAWLAMGAFGTWVAYRRWASTFWQLDGTGLHLRRGRMWKREVLVPRSRVQHLDIERGPIERRYVLATLVVHTAGTRHHALRIAGLADADAVALRDALVPDAGLHDDVL